MSFRIGDRPVGPGHPVYIVAEIGINHNGDLDTALRLMGVAKVAGCDAVKFQKRTVDAVYTAEELARPRESVFGKTNGDLKRGLEFGEAEYRRIAARAAELGIDWFASCWDEASVDFIEGFNPPAYKVASASLTDWDLLSYICKQGRPVILSTGMSTQSEVGCALGIIYKFKVPVALLHCNSTYPCPPEELNLRCIQTLNGPFPGVEVGYSGHEVSPVPSVVAVGLGACIVERHITLDRSMWGSDQAASLEPGALAWMVKHIRATEAALGDGVKRVTAGELPVRDKLRRSHAIGR